MLADMKTQVEAARALMWQAPWKVSTGADALAEISMAKLFSSETYVAVANMGMQIFGAFGYLIEYSTGRFPLIEALELPFVVSDATSGSRATWACCERYAKGEFEAYMVLALRVGRLINITMARWERYCSGASLAATKNYSTLAIGRLIDVDRCRICQDDVRDY